MKHVSWRFEYWSCGAKSIHWFMIKYSICWFSFSESQLLAARPHLSYYWAKSTFMKIYLGWSLGYPQMLSFKVWMNWAECNSDLPLKRLINNNSSNPVVHLVHQFGIYIGHIHPISGLRPSVPWLPSNQKQTSYYYATGWYAMKPYRIIIMNFRIFNWIPVNVFFENFIKIV